MMIALAVGPAQSPCRGERLCDRPLGTQLMGSSRATKGITVPPPRCSMRVIGRCDQPSGAETPVFSTLPHCSQTP